MESMGWEGFMPPRGYVALPRRWVVKQTFSWLGQNVILNLIKVVHGPEQPACEPPTCLTLPRSLVVSRAAKLLGRRFILTIGGMWMAISVLSRANTVQPAGATVA
jgi:hypothetical protein